MKKKAIVDDFESDVTTQPGHKTVKEKVSSLYTYLVGSNEDKLIQAVFDGNQSRVMELIDKGADQCVIDKDGNTLVHVAVKGRQGDMFGLLANLGMDVNCVNEDGVTPLIYAIQLGFDDVVTELLRIKGIDVNHRDHSGRTALHHCAICGNATVADILLENGIGIDHTDVTNNTALHLCCERDTFNVAKVLLRWNACLFHKNQHGFTPLGTAVNNRNRNMIKLMTAAMKGTDHPDFDKNIDKMMDLTHDLDYYKKVLNTMPVHFTKDKNDFEDVRQA
ncbi:ankyrin repeat-containing protein, putative [Entamoeba invadens IP1]|uniref:ankyrin repeat-containing protein, putative n=1 Tax=Entamoeba invadens IP1 TaxID=370355 RepID=UPI0002C3EC58|nr:ankyrin repeat-containing protein, putative [Entamoeba invadens IP1]ELP85015.1 ankyrin repeat-containing protein, putative [Entamoeba invadens IP1]|eukprot:XP_004184361.1 ankyrin repeat-containing protein, putative [Entamoeba invadens IP1]